MQDHPADHFALDAVCACQPCRQQQGCNSRLVVLEVLGARVQLLKVVGQLCLSALHTIQVPGFQKSSIDCLSAAYMTCGDGCQPCRQQQVTGGSAGGD